MEELPEGWARVALGECLTPGGLFDGPFGSSLKTTDYTAEGVRVIRLENLANLRFVGEKQTFISETKYESLRKHTVREGDVLFGSFVDGAPRVCLLPRLDGTAIAKADCFCIRPIPWVLDPCFLVYLLGSPATRDTLIEEIHGTTRPRVTTRQLRHHEVLVPPMAEQERIVAKIDALLAQVRAARDHLERVQQILSRLRQSVLAAACEDRLIASGLASSPWDSATLQVLSTRITKGTTPTSYGHSFQRTGIPFVKVENLRNGRIDGASIRDFISEETHLAQHRSALEPGDVLFSIAGTIGATAVVTAVDVPANTNQAVAIIRGTEPRIDTAFLLLALSSVVGQGAANERARGGGMNNISLSDLRQFVIPVPPRQEQEEIVNRARRLFAMADSIQSRLATVVKHATAAPGNILTQAFIGELVPTEAALARAEGRTYESGEEILARVRAERAANSAITPGPRRGQTARPRRPSARRRTR